MFTALLCCYQIFRGVFLGNNLALYQPYAWTDLAYAWLLGLVFDLSAIALTNFPFLIYWSMAWQKPWRGGDLALRGLFLLVNFAAISLNLIDCEYVRYGGSRMTLAAIKAIYGDLGHQQGSILTDFWPFFVLTAALSSLLFLMQQLSPGSATSWKQKTARLLTLILVFGLMIRGGPRYKPLSVPHALLAGDAKLMQLSLNSTFTFLRTYKESLEPLSHYNNWAALTEALHHERRETAKPTDVALTKPTNVVILLIESMSLEYLGMEQGAPCYAPFLKELIKHSSFFPSHFSNGRRSIDALPAILAGLPVLMEKAFIVSGYEHSNIEAMPRTLKNHGYTTAFFHGGNPGTMYFDVMTQLLGFSHEYTSADYPDQSQHDGNWGIYDGPYLQFAAEEMNRLPKPFFSMIFTLSSHHPYLIPKVYQDKFPKGTLEIHESIGYTDMAIAEFFATAQKQDWYNQTLFIITADHTGLAQREPYPHHVWRNRVPLMLFAPGQTLNLDTNVLSQHLDLKPTIYDILGIEPSEESLFGSSLTRKLAERQILLHHGDGFYWLLAEDQVHEFDPNFHEKAFNWRLDPNHKTPLTATKSRRDSFLAWLQYFRNGLIENHMLLPLERQNVRNVR